jgi:hypothetical protein
MIQKELKTMILEETLASGLNRKDAEKVTELAFAQWTELIRAEVPDRDAPIKEHLASERLLELLRHAVDKVWEDFMRAKDEGP